VWWVLLITLQVAEVWTRGRPRQLAARSKGRLVATLASTSGEVMTRAAVLVLVLVLVGLPQRLVQLTTVQTCGGAAAQASSRAAAMVMTFGAAVRLRLPQ